MQYRSIGVPFFILPAFLALHLFLSVSCTDTEFIIDPYLSGSSLDVVAPSWIPEGSYFPVLLRLPNSNPRELGWGTYSLSSTGSIEGTFDITIKHGYGSSRIRLLSVGSSSIEIHNQIGKSIGKLNVSVVDSLDVCELSGELQDQFLIWRKGIIYSIVSDISVAANQVLRVEPGARIELGHLANIRIDGSIICEGTAAEPVIFTSRQESEPWGEIRHNRSQGKYRYTFFTSGGGDPGRAFGHSGSQPVLKGNSCTLELNNVYIIDNPGKALGFGRSVLSLDSCMVSRCDTGGELSRSQAVIKNSYFIDMPDDSPEEIDDDNDAIYFAGEGALDTSIVMNCVFSTGKDDGIDHNGANVKIYNCIIENFDNEGVACSNEKSVTLFNTRITDCEQGVEAGFGNPDVTVDHCLFINNDTGIRFGDSYGTASSGRIIVRNSISVRNKEYDVLNYDPQIDGQIEGAVWLDFTIAGRQFYSDGQKIPINDPSFDRDWTLTPDYGKYFIGDDGKIIGLLN